MNPLTNLLTGLLTHKTAACLLYFLLMGVLGCAEVPPPRPTIFPTPFPTLAASPTPLLDTGWETLAPGLERRWQNVVADGIRTNRLYIVRIDPTYYRFDIGYSPGKPWPLSLWREQTGADVVINGGYFTEEMTATGLMIVDGDVSGWNYTFGGMVDIRAGALRVRPLIDEPYQAGELIDDGLQAFPLLVQPGGVDGYSDVTADRDRRTVIAQDRAGKIIVMVADMPQFTLTELSAWLLASDLEIDIALNLDGGTSSGILLAQGDEGVPSFVALPTVITVHKK